MWLDQIMFRPSARMWMRVILNSKAFGRLAAGLLIFVSTGLLEIAYCSGQVESHNAGSGAERVRELINSLPRTSQVRKRLLNGARGDGVHYQWMDDMRRIGIRRAVVETEFNFKGDKPTNIRVIKTVWFAKY